MCAIPKVDRRVDDRRRSRGRALTSAQPWLILRGPFAGSPLSEFGTSVGLQHRDDRVAAAGALNRPPDVSIAPHLAA